MKLEDFRHKSALWWTDMMNTVAFADKNDPFGVRLEMPSDCSPPEVNLFIMTKPSDRIFESGYIPFDYCLCFEDGFRYDGRNEHMKEASTGKPICFDSWVSVMTFLESMTDSEDDPDPPEIIHTHRQPDIIPEESKRPEFSRTPDVDVNTLTDFSAVQVTRNQAEQISFRTLRKELGKSIMDQDAALDTLAFQTAAFLNKPHPQKPLSFMAHGGPGIGKSEAGKVLGRIASQLSEHPFSVVWTDLNTFTESHTVYRLIGSPAGYVGYDDPPLFDEVVKNPYTLFIFDELDKAHPQVLKIFMAILDEGRCASNKELSDHTRIYNFQHCIFFFTSNYNLTERKHIGFSVPEEIESITSKDNAISIEYSHDKANAASLTQKIYAQNEKARRGLIASGHLPEVASRIGNFVEFKPLSESAKIRILAKQIVESGFEYGIKLTYIAPGIMQELTNAAVAENILTVRSFRPVIEGYLAETFAATGALSGADEGAYLLEGTLAKPVLKKNGK